MKNLFKTELKRGFYSKEFMASLIIGFAISVWHFIEYFPLGQMVLEFGKMDRFSSRSMLFNLWMGASPSTVQGYYYFLLIPFLAVLPYGTTLYRDFKSKYTNNIFLRLTRKKYFVIKWMVLFLTGGAAVSLPLVLNFILFMNVFPLEPLQVGNAMFPIIDGGFLSRLIITHPLVYNLIFLLLIFLIGGFFATFSLLFTFIAEYEFIVLFAPLLIELFLMTILSVFRLDAFDPINIIKPFNVGLGIGTSVYKSASVVIIMWLISISPLVIQNKEG